MKQALRNFCIAATGFTLLAACGGSDSNDGGLNIAPPTSQPAAITADNAPLIAGAVAEVAMGQGVFSSIFSPDVPIASGGMNVAVSPVMKPVLSTALKTANPSQLYATSAGREDCAVSGTVDIQVDVRNPLGPSVDDRFDFEFTNCDDGSGVVVDGGMTITITALEGDPESGNFLLGMQIDFSALAMTEGNETTSATGTINIDIDTSDPLVSKISISTRTFVTTTEGMEECRTNLTIAITEDASTFPVAVTVEASFTISSPRIGGEVTVTTSLALQSMGEDYPFVGELRITGADNAVIVMIALDANTVRLEIDIDGDQAVDETMDITWDELMAEAA